MRSEQRCWSLASLLLLLLAGRNLGVNITIHRDSVNGTVGGSVLLPVSYQLERASDIPLSITWTFRNSPNLFISCTVHNCTLVAGGVPHNCFTKCIPGPTSHSRAKSFPGNGSLLLWDLQLSDSGNYSVLFRPSGRTWTISLDVGEQPPTPQHPGPVDPDHNYYYTIGICSSVSLLLLLLLVCCLWRWGASCQQKRNMKLQQVSRVEENPLDSSVVRDMVTIYATVGFNFEAQSSEVVYTTVNSPRLRGRDPGPYHLPV